MPSVSIADQALAPGNNDEQFVLSKASGDSFTFEKIDLKPNQKVSVDATTISDPESLSEGTVSDVVSQPATGAAPSDKETNLDHESIATQVLKIVERYGVHFERGEGTWDGFEQFLPIVARQVASNEPVRLLLPGFPFKSPNSRDQVLGALPDLGEELALAHLDGLCQNIAAVYEHGAEVHICSDGLVYNDLLGVTDEAVWEYGEALRQVTVRNDLNNVKFIRLWDLLDHPGHLHSGEEDAKAYYISHAPCIRRELFYRYGDPNVDASQAIESDKNISLTYQGYTEFLKKELATSSDHQSLSTEAQDSKVLHIAKSMITRGKAYAAALQANRSDFVRLSIHNSVGKGKLTLSLIPQAERGSLGLTPWRSSIAIEADGSYRTVYASDVRDTHELVYKGGRPYCFRVKSELFDWAPSGLKVDFDHQYPCGVIIRPIIGGENGHETAPSMSLIPMEKVRHLAHHFSPIVMRGFDQTVNEEIFSSKAHELGKVLTWTFGTILKVRDSGEVDAQANNVTSNEAMPMHFDGIFKFEDREDPETGEIKKVLNPPGYQYFTCLATAPKGSGYTLFCNSRLFFRHVPSEWPLSRLSPVTWTMENDGFWSAKQEGLPLVKAHPTTGAPCLRWHQPWDRSKTKFSTYVLTIDNDEQRLADVINTFTYDYRVCYRFTWEVGDLLVNDNVAMLHTRTGYTTKCDREMWRIHFD